jgi:putative membrane protein
MQRRHALIAATGAAAVAMLNAPGAIAQIRPAGAIGAGEYRARTLQLGSLAKQSALLAQQRASYWQVRQFGAFEADEQTAMAQVLTDDDSPNPPLAPIDATQTQMLQQLSTLRGPEFDSAFLRGQLMGHERLLHVQQAFLAGAPFSWDLAHIAVLARMVIMQHITMLHDMQNQIPGMIAAR